jgi:aminoglycoside phosphotransferase (APT) family kinase protein
MAAAPALAEAAARPEPCRGRPLADRVRGVSSPDAVRDVLAEHLPGHRVDSVELLGAGLDNVAYEVNGELIVRFANDGDAASVDREARLLVAVAGISPLPVPRPCFTAPERGCLAYRKLAGIPLLELPSARAEPVAAVLGEFLAALHAAPAERFTGLVEPDDQPLDDWLRECAELFAANAARIPARHHRPIETFLAAPPPPERARLVFSHNDLGSEHVLVDPDSAAVTGIIDWSDAALTDPAHDFGLILRDLGPAALDAALARHGDRSLHERAVFYGRCGALEDLAYGVTTGRDRYRRNAVAALAWLFDAA